MASGLLGGIAFNTFLPLYGKDLGLDRVAPVLLVGSGTMVVIRALGGQLPDRLGFVRGGTTAVGLMGTGVLVAALWGTVPGLYVGAVVLFSGSALLYPTLAAAADVGVPDEERSAVMASFTMFIDLSAALGGPLFGLVAAGTSYRGAFVVASCMAAAGLVLLHTRLAQPYRMRLAASATR
jgi:MFS family permease